MNAALTPLQHPGDEHDVLRGKKKKKLPALGLRIQH